MNKVLTSTHRINFSKALLKHLAILSFVVANFAHSPAVQAKTDTNLWLAHDTSSQKVLDNSDWQSILDLYVAADPKTGIHLVNYSALKERGLDQLGRYIALLESTDPLTLNQNEQLAYWLNLYNALTLQLVAENYPVKSIRKLGKGFFSFGPWDDDVTEINGQVLTLNDIEHRIIRPVYQDNRIHYAVNCASIGCPNLSLQAYQGSLLDQQLDSAASEFINHPRGLSLKGTQLTLSKIYQWYEEDFGDDTKDLLQHLRAYVTAEVGQGLESTTIKALDIDYEYDWSLNDMK